MSAPAEVPASNATESKPTEDNAAIPENPAPKIEVPTTTNTDNVNQNNSKPIKKVKSKKDLKNDPSRFEPPGVNFNAKLIGIDDVGNARGDKMCQDSMYRLKIAVKQSGQHKQKVIINVSIDGIRIIDVRTHAANHTHAVHRISFISRDVTDARAFGYVFGAGEGKHKFFAIKTEKAAEALVLTLRDLFQVVYELKKKEVEDAKHKIVQPVEHATEAKENPEPVNQVPSSEKTTENDADPTYQVPTNNRPVQRETPDLLQMETELETIERRIEQIDTMEELFKELEAPPTTATSNPGPGGHTFASDLASLSHGIPQTQTQPMFSVGGTTFSTGQPFLPPPPGTQIAFPGAGQPFGHGGQPFGAVGQPVGQFGAFPQQPQATPFAGQPNLFQPPSVPPRTAMAFPGQPFPVTPFPGTEPQAPFSGAVPGLPGAQPTVSVAQPTVSVTPANDPFGGDPFSSNMPFEEGVLMPARMESQVEETPPEQSAKTDVFGDLVQIGGKTKANASPKDMFVELTTPTKKTLNELKVDGVPSPKPSSPVGFQASGSSLQTDIDATYDPFLNSDKPFGTSDPFASDPFTSTNTEVPQPPPQFNTRHDALFGVSLFGDNDFSIPLPQGPPPPLPNSITNQSKNLAPPRTPPPPLPHIIASQSQNLAPPGGHPPSLPTHIPPLPPRPKSTSSDSNKSNGSGSSLTESQNSQHSTPPLPPRPKPNNSVSLPRPRPRTALLNSSPNSTTLSLQQTVDTNKDQNTGPNNHVINVTIDSINNNVSNCVNSGCDTEVKQAILEYSSPESATEDKTLLYESHKINSSAASKPVERTFGSVVDPFGSTDPFASDDPFTQSDPFANDPFAQDPFAESNTVEPVSKDDPFTDVVTSPRVKGGVDPFSVFDNTLSNDSTFKFERSSAKKAKVKVSGQ